ncbi:MAG: type II secretion system protein GspH [Candidatus Contendobacter odensis]|uniref:Type II secretion system protein H n=1 Tax=Candidatus Contendibacter odensensis TaxID=1400860 RepID=A0A2G6PE28_9GAMM|nr:MAG: type II secretion system protein GspH [Candidatus Contendobacter odensis]
MVVARVISRATATWAGAGQRGFTLLEILVVLVIAILLVNLVPPLLSGLSGSTELRGAARRLAAGLRSARNEAVTRQREAVLTLDLEKHHFTVSGDARQVTLPDHLTFKFYTAQSEVLDEKAGSIRFFPDGSSTGGHIIISGAAYGYRINVDWLTGMVAIVDQGGAP